MRYELCIMQFGGEPGDDISKVAHYVTHQNKI
jgi:hypothetical protein